MKRLLAAFAFLVVHSAVAQTVDPASLLPDALRTRGVIRLATAAINDPHAYRKAGSDEVVGFEIDLAKDIARRLSMRLQIDVVGFDALVTGLRGGRFDVAASALAVSEERAGAVDFLPTSQTSFAILTMRGNPTGIADMNALCGRTVAVLDASRPLELVQEQQARCKAAGRPEIALSILPRGGSAVAALLSGRVEANVVSRPRGLATQRETDGRIEVLRGPPISEQQVGFAFAKGSPWRAAFAAAFDGMVKDGTYRDILERNKVSDLMIGGS